MACGPITSPQMLATVIQLLGGQNPVGLNPALSAVMKGTRPDITMTVTCDADNKPVRWSVQRYFDTKTQTTRDVELDGEIVSETISVAMPGDGQVAHIVDFVVKGQTIKYTSKAECAPGNAPAEPPVCTTHVPTIEGFAFTISDSLGDWTRVIPELEKLKEAPPPPPPPAPSASAGTTSKEPDLPIRTDESQIGKKEVEAMIESAIAEASKDTPAKTNPWEALLFGLAGAALIQVVREGSIMVSNVRKKLRQLEGNFYREVKQEVKPGEVKTVRVNITPTVLGTALLEIDAIKNIADVVGGNLEEIVAGHILRKASSRFTHVIDETMVFHADSLLALMPPNVDDALKEDLRNELKDGLKLKKLLKKLPTS